MKSLMEVRPVSVLVTGNVGFLGQHITRNLSAVGVAWCGLDRRPNGGGRQILGDVRDICSMQIDPDTIAEIIHLASPTGVRTTSWHDDSIYEEITATAIALSSFARQAGARVLFMSSSEIYGEASTVIRSRTEPNPLSGYARGKLEAEKILSTSLPTTVVIRPFNVYGPGQRPEFIVPTIIDCVLAGRPVPLVREGRAIRQFIYVADFVEAVRRVREGWAKFSRHTLNVSGPEAIGIQDLAAAVGHLLRRQVSFVSVTPEEIGRNPATEITCRTAEVTSINGWQPRTTFADGLSLTIAAHCDSSLTQVSTS
jgi:nucleoside-diphosphate-sugar epimerase